MYCLVRGKKCIVSMGKRAVWLTLFENITLFSLPLNGIFLFLQLEDFILDLGPENSFLKKGKRNTCVQQEKISIVVRLGAVFIKKIWSNPSFPLRPNGNSNLLNLSHN